MSDPKTDDSPVEGVPETVVRQRSRISTVWVIPVVAAMIGGWLAYKAITDRGPAVTIVFKTAEGLEAGKTKVKYKDLEMGVVEEIQLSEDLSEVKVTARMVKGSERFLKDETRFWVMRARLSGGQVSGLGTIFSGAYVGMDPVLDGKPRRDFVGLEVPPIVTTRRAGRLFVLRSPTLGSLEIGSPVYLRKVKVGQVVAHELDVEAGFVTINIFIEAPYEEQVRSNTRFWNVSGFDVILDASGVRLETESIISILLGGIAFDTPAVNPGAPVTAGAGFPLYASRGATLAETYTLKQLYLLHFHESVRGLSPGSPVEFHGIKVGQVTDVTLEFEPETDDFRVPIVIEVEPERIEIEGGNAAAIPERFPRLVERGLRAQLKTANLITGQLAVDLDIHPDAEPAKVLYEGPYPELPTLPTPFGAVTASLTKLVGRIEQLPLEDIGGDLRASLGSLRKTLEESQVLVEQLNSELTPSIVAAAREAEGTLAKAGDFVGPESPVNREVRRLLVELTDAARAVRLAAEQLERNPESLLRGKEAEE